MLFVGVMTAQSGIPIFSIHLLVHSEGNWEWVLDETVKKALCKVFESTTAHFMLCTVLYRCSQCYVKRKPFNTPVYCTKHCRNSDANSGLREKYECMLHSTVAHTYNINGLWTQSTACIKHRLQQLPKSLDKQPKFVEVCKFVQVMPKTAPFYYYKKWCILEWVQQRHHSAKTV